MPPVPNVPPNPYWHQDPKFWYPKDCVPGPLPINLPINLPSKEPPPNNLRRYRPDQQQQRQRPAPYPPRPTQSYSTQMTTYSQSQKRSRSRSGSHPPQPQPESYSQPPTQAYHPHPPDDRRSRSSSRPPQPQHYPNQQPQTQAPTPSHHSQLPNGRRSRSSSRPPQFPNPQPQHHPNQQSQAQAPTQSHHSQPQTRSRSHSIPPTRDARPPSRNSRPATPAPARSRSPYPRREDDGRRAILKDLANDTIKALNSGLVDVSTTQQHTQLFLEDSQELIDWRQPRHPRHPSFSHAKITVQPLSTLKGARLLHDRAQPGTKIGVLNFASATSPGGGFLNGARAQEESIARSSSLYVSLITEAANPFYALHAGRGENHGFYTHAMIYSPEVHLFRDDDGAWLDAIPVDIVTSPAVNAGKVRKRYLPTSGLERNIEGTMHERMARILALFEMKGATSLVLGSFGTGVFQNDVAVVAGIWRDLLKSRNARFRSSFKEVTFCIPDAKTREVFETALYSRGGGRGPYVPPRGGDGVGVS